MDGVTIADIKLWAIGERNIGHVLMSQRSGWTYTACQSFGPGFDIQKKKPDRICAACRKALTNLKPVPQ